MRVGGQRHGPAALLPGKKPATIVQEAGLKARCTDAENPVRTGIRSRTVQLAASRYTN